MKTKTKSKSKLKTFFFTETATIRSQGFQGRNVDEALQKYYDYWSKLNVGNFEIDCHQMTIGLLNKKTGEIKDL